MIIIRNIPEEREFGFVTSKIVRPVKVRIGRTRRKISKNLVDSAIKDDITRIRKADRLINNPEPAITSKEVRNNLLKNEGPRLKTSVSYKADTISSAGGTGRAIYKSHKDLVSKIIDDPAFKKEDKKLLKKLVGKDKESIVAVSKKPGHEALAHELGHANGRLSKGKRGKIHKSDPRSSVDYTPSVSGFGHSEGRYGEKYIGKDRVSFKEAIQDLKKNNKLTKAIVREEEAANKDGIKMLKKAGASKKEIKSAKKNFKEATDTYRLVRGSSVKSSLARAIDIPSRRVKNKNLFL